ncbi:ABC transporter ATP-binding protein [Streptomyces beijiangensis]|uniref:ABC transporter ATP-binding protein n=1 Tax=Streptomyces beijiangensis TaxID=163361 RepID=A0A939F628_9ACTN|nr:ABC transporter ATP-binding protein [Streptomyces beijiangensis]MBO0513261.1 ABC transporter ATP-binding protein [Streptomyces beijiangensis]
MTDVLEGGIPAPHADPGSPLIRCENLVRIFWAEQVEVQALQGLDLSVPQGELLAVVGASGSGKSTLLGILSGLDVPTAGTATVDGFDLLAMKRRDRVAFRRHTVGFVWQQTARNLFPYLSALENVMQPMAYTGRKLRARRARAAELLDLFNIGYAADRRPDALSGGEQQRVAIAVAVANDPRVLFADEPTGELDTETANEVFGALRRANAELGTTIVVVTHDAMVSEQVRRTVGIRNGRTSSEVLRDHEAQVSEEFAVLDRNGRLQLPREHIERYGLKDRVRLSTETDHLGIWADAGAQALPETGGGGDTGARSQHRTGE